MGWDTLVTLATRVLLLGVTMLSNVIVARTLGAAGNGIYAYVLVTASLVANLGGLGLGVANVRLVGERRYPISDIVMLSLVASIGLGLLWLAVTLLFSGVLHGFLFAGFKLEYAQIGAFGVPLLLAFGYFSNILLGSRQIGRYNLLTSIQSLALLISLATVLVVLHLREKAAISAWIFSLLVATTCSVIAVAKLGPLGRLDAKLAKEAFVFGLKAHLGNVFGLLNYRSSFLIMGAMMDARSLGVYSVAVALAEVVLYFPNAVALALLPRVCSGSSHEANLITPVVCRQTILLTSIGVLCAALVGKPLLVRLYGAEYSVAAVPLYILLAGMVVLAATKILSSDLTGRGKPLVPTLSVLVSLGVNIGLLLVLVPKWGLIGAAVATVIAFVVEFAVQLSVHLAVSGNRLTETLFPRYDDFQKYVPLAARTLLRLREGL